MITRHHISLGLGSLIILYLPLLAGCPSLLLVLAPGVCIGAVLPDIQMKKPKTLQLLTFAWLIIHIFKTTFLRTYIAIFNCVWHYRPVDSDKRLLHSLPGLVFVSGIAVTTVVLSWALFPSDGYAHWMRIFLGSIIFGMLFHFIADTCTRKGLCLFYPFSEAYLLAGTIRPCRRDDNRIRNFHMIVFTGAFIVFVFTIKGILPGNLKYIGGIPVFVICTILMLAGSGVELTYQSRPENHVFREEMS